jgi:hypothetical protein
VCVWFVVALTRQVIPVEFYVGNHDAFLWTFKKVRLDESDSLDDLHSLADATEDCMTVVEKLTRCECDEELAVNLRIYCLIVKTLVCETLSCLPLVSGVPVFAIETTPAPVCFNSG